VAQDIVRLPLVTLGVAVVVLAGERGVVGRKVLDLFPKPSVR
jgi:hypothetical protein